MLSLPASVRVYLSTAPADLRRSFDGLCVLVEQVFGREPLDGHLFLFLNRRRDRIKILYWDRDGLALWYKRLEAGTFQRNCSTRVPACKTRSRSSSRSGTSCS